MSLFSSAPKIEGNPNAPTKADTGATEIIERQKQSRRRGFGSTILTGAVDQSGILTGASGSGTKKTLLGQ